jgi:hypothetical protein
MSQDRCLICRDTENLLDAHSGSKPYQHIYHLACIREWFTHSHKFTCVLCSGNFAPLFFRELVVGQPKDFIKICVGAICCTADLDLPREFISNHNKFQDDALVAACESGHLETIKLLIANGADIHAHNDKALKIASKKGHTDIVDFLNSKLNHTA